MSAHTAGPLDRPTLLRMVLEYADRRWYWDDRSFLEEAFERGFGPADTPAAFVDALAAKYGLTDPHDGWQGNPPV
jgi:hypothetical protein